MNYISKLKELLVINYLRSVEIELKYLLFGY